MTDIDIDKRLGRLQDATDDNARMGAQYAKRLDALEAEIREIKQAMQTLIETAPTPEGRPAHG